MMRLLLMTLAVSPLFATRSQAELLVHYTFDSGDIAGSTIFDTAGGDNNATAIGGVGLSAPGVLGEAIRFPNDDGASYAVLPSGSNPAPNGAAPRTLAFWFSQEAVGVENKMFGYGTGGFGQSFDVSLEGGGIRLRYSGGNVTWGSGFDFVGADAGFHHLAIRVPNGASVYTDIDVFLDGVELTGVPTAGSPASTAINTGGGSPTTLNLGRSPAFDPAGDFIGLMDDFRIYSTPLSDQEIEALAGGIDSLLVDVDPVTGALSLRNPTDSPIAIDYYEIASPSGALSPTGWVSLETQDRVGFPSGDGSGDGWEVLGSPSNSLLVEGLLTSESTISPGQSLPLGQPLNPFFGLEVEVVYRSGGVFRTAREGATAPGVLGDYNGDGSVDVADYTVWRDTLGTQTANLNDLTPGQVTVEDYTIWADAIINSNGTTIPEPSCLLMAFAALIAIQRGYGAAFDAKR